MKKSFLNTEYGISGIRNFVEYATQFRIPLIPHSVLAAFRILLIPYSVFLTACSYTLPVKDGRTAYERKRFADAAPMLEREFQGAKSRVERGQLAYLVADSYHRTGRHEQSLEWYKTAYDNNYGPDALRGHAFALKRLERYKEAQEDFKNLGIEIGSPYEYRKEITACNVSQGWLKEAPTNGFTLTPTAFNSPQNDFAPALAPDGRLVFTSDRTAATGKDSYRWTGNRFMDLFAVEPTGASAQAFDPLTNSEGNDGTACFSNKGDEMFFVRAEGAYEGDDAWCRIFQTARDRDGQWSAPTPLPFQKDKINYLHPCLAPDGNTLYFASNDPEGWGGFDLYSVTRQPNNETGWSEPRLLSRALNTPGNELFPTFDADTLYFASDGLPGMGGLDVFRSYRMERHTWAPPINLKAPLNSGADDFGLIVDHSTPKPPTPKKPGDLIRSGFLTSNRPAEGARGGDDIYRFEQRVPPPAPPKVDTTPAAPLVYKLILEGYVLEKIFAETDNPNSKVLGRRPLDGAKVDMAFGGKKQSVTVGADGYFKLELTENTDYSFVANKANYLANSAKFSTRGMAKDPANPVQTYEIEIVLDRIYRDREIVLENIYYDYDKWDIRPDAEPTLNRLAEVLHQNPNIRIQLGSHTDCRGDNSYNQNLSQRRAESAVNYLIGKGIASERLGAVGYGESQPAADCQCSKCSEAEHQTNRRTTFRIVD